MKDRREYKMSVLGSHQEVLAGIASREWQMLETVGQFGLRYSEEAQSTLGSLVATSSLLNRVMSPRGRTQR